MKTSLPKLGLIEDTFSKLKEEGCDAVFCVPICKGLSSTFQSLEMVANQVGLKFYGVDCYVTAVVQDRMIEIAKEMIEKGHSPEEAIQRLERIAASCETVLLCDDLQHMKRGDVLPRQRRCWEDCSRSNQFFIWIKERKGVSMSWQRSGR